MYQINPSLEHHVWRVCTVVYQGRSAWVQTVRIFPPCAVLGWHHFSPAKCLSFLLSVSGLRNQYTTSALIKIQGLDDCKDVQFYLGKRIAYVYKAKTAKSTSGSASATKFRVIWGKVTKAHGTNGVTRCQFRKNLPPKAIGGPVRIMLYPSSI